jgi:hypothetical protein
LQALDALHAQQPKRVQRVAVAQQLALAVLALQLGATARGRRQ